MKFSSIKAFLTMLLLGQQFVLHAQDKTMEEYIKAAPFKMPSITIPVFQDKSFSIADFDGKGNGKKLNTDAFAKAIEACSNAGGGKVIIPKGTWLTGPIELKSNVELHAEKDAVIQFTSDHTQYPFVKAGSKSTSLVPASPIYGYDLENIAITGEGVFDGAGDSWRPVKKDKTSEEGWEKIVASGGVLDAKGKVWWPSREAMNGEEYLKQLKKKSPKPTAEEMMPAREYMRPYMLYLVNCKNVLIQGVTLRNSPKFIFYPNHCYDLTMDRVNLYNDWWAQNGDAIDISACKKVMIYKCVVNAGDDGICMKSSGGKSDDAAAGPALENVVIAACVVLRGHGGFVIGSNTDGGMERIYVTDCTFVGTDIGIRVKSNAGRGGLVKDIYIDNIKMNHILKEAILFTTFYEDVTAGKEKGDVVTTDHDKVPEFTQFHISNVSCNGASKAISITGLPDMPAHHLYFSNMDITADSGFEAIDAKDIELKNVKLNTKSQPAFKADEKNNIRMID
jgi:polygalacturonase